MLCSFNSLTKLGLWHKTSGEMKSAHRAFSVIIVLQRAHSAVMLEEESANAGTPAFVIMSAC